MMSIDILVRVVWSHTVDQQAHDPAILHRSSVVRVGAHLAAIALRATELIALRGSFSTSSGHKQVPAPIPVGADRHQEEFAASDSAVAIKKRVNGFELIVRQRNGHQRRQCRFMQELFPGRETRLDLSRSGWDVGSSCDSAARLANPILNLAKTSGRCLVPLNARREFFVQLAGKPDATGKFLEARDSVL